MSGITGVGQRVGMVTAGAFRLTSWLLVGAAAAGIAEIGRRALGVAPVVDLTFVDRAVVDWSSAAMQGVGYQREVPQDWIFPAVVTATAAVAVGLRVLANKVGRLCRPPATQTAGLVAEGAVANKDKTA